VSCDQSVRQLFLSVAVTLEPLRPVSWQQVTFVPNQLYHDEEYGNAVESEDEELRSNVSRVDDGPNES